MTVLFFLTEFSTAAPVCAFAVTLRRVSTSAHSSDCILLPEGARHREKSSILRVNAFPDACARAVSNPLPMAKL